MKPMEEIMIASRKVGRGHPPFIVAEMSGNHGQSLDRALAIVEAAAKAGAHALKMQTFTADTITLDVSENEFFISDPNNRLEGDSLYTLYEKAHTPWEWHEPILNRCKELGIIGFSAPFDETAVDFLESLNVPCYKIASFENVHIPLIRKVAATGMPVIMSTGMASEDELAEAVKVAREAGCENIILLKCTSVYPADPDSANILTIPHMRELFNLQVGLSDHTIGIGVALASVALGATVIEKHFTLDQSDDGIDSSFSLEPDDLRALVVESERAWRALGDVSYGPSEKEKASLQFRRSLYIAQDMKKGDVFTEKNLRAVRPGLGLPPKHLPSLIGRRIAKDARKGTPLSWDIVENF